MQDCQSWDVPPSYQISSVQCKTVKAGTSLPPIRSAVFNARLSKLGRPSLLPQYQCTGLLCPPTHHSHSKVVCCVTQHSVHPHTTARWCAVSHSTLSTHTPQPQQGGVLCHTALCPPTHHSHSTVVCCVTQHSVHPHTTARWCAVSHNTVHQDHSCMHHGNVSCYRTLLAACCPQKKAQSHTLKPSTPKARKTNAQTIYIQMSLQNLVSSSPEQCTSEKQWLLNSSDRPTLAQHLIVKLIN